MSKMDEFKKFASERPYLKEKIDNKETTWQELYERYDLYGENDEIFKEPKKEEKTSSKKDDSGLGGFFDMLSGIDIDKIADGLNGMRKVLSILGELSASQDNRQYKKNAEPFSRDDD